LKRGVHGHYDNWHNLRDAAHEAGLLAKVPLTALDRLHERWKTAISVDPLPRDEAAEALTSAKTVLATIPL
jgi:hypothetical protein